MIRVEPSDPHSRESQQLIALLTEELARITGDGGTNSFRNNGLSFRPWACEYNERIFTFRIIERNRTYGLGLLR